MPQPVILSDIGNVLVAFDFSIAARRCAERCPFPAEELFHRLDSIKLPYENGEMDDETFVLEAIARLKFEGTQAEFKTIWCEIFTQNDAMDLTLAPLAGKLPMYLLSNTSGLHKNHLLSSYPIFRHFQDGVYSYSARCSKPDESIFWHTIDQLDLDPALTFFIDDLPANIATAQRLGFHTHAYDLRRHQDLEQALDRWLQGHLMGI
jgi:HAD superfamily hydrolase (TIGR01509 family)